MAKVTHTHSVDDNRGLVFGGYLPLAWRVVDALPSVAQLDEQASTNLETLKILSLLDTPPAEPGDDTTEAKSQDIVRLDLKLNLVLELVGQLLVQQRMSPDICTLTLTPNSLTWQSNEKPAVGSLLLIELHCSLRYPRPLYLYGRVSETGDQSQIQVTFQALSEALEEALEQFIFVHHRRAIAQSRRQPNRHTNDIS